MYVEGTGQPALSVGERQLDAACRDGRCEVVDDRAPITPRLSLGAVRGATWLGQAQASRPLFRLRAARALRPRCDRSSNGQDSSGISTMASGQVVVGEYPETTSTPPGSYRARFPWSPRRSWRPRPAHSSRSSRRAPSGPCPDLRSRVSQPEPPVAPARWTRVIAALTDADEVSATNTPVRPAARRGSASFRSSKTFSVATSLNRISAFAYPILLVSFPDGSRFSVEFSDLAPKEKDGGSRRRHISVSRRVDRVSHD